MKNLFVSLIFIGALLGSQSVEALSCVPPNVSQQLAFSDFVAVGTVESIVIDEDKSDGIDDSMLFLNKAIVIKGIPTDKQEFEFGSGGFFWSLPGEGEYAVIFADQDEDGALTIPNCHGSVALSPSYDEQIQSSYGYESYRELHDELLEYRSINDTIYSAVDESSSATEKTQQLEADISNLRQTLRVGTVFFVSALILVYIKSRE